MCAEAGNLSLGTLMTEALLVPLESVNEKITDSLSNNLVHGPATLSSCLPPLSSVSLWNILETDAVLSDKVLWIGLYLSLDS